MPAYIVLAAGPTRARDAAAGQAVFKAQCGICRAVQPDHNMIGPTLFGVVGRPAGKAAGYSYSAANANSGLTWDTATLDRYLTSPQAIVPHTKMGFGGLKDDARCANLIAYLATLRQAKSKAAAPRNIRTGPVSARLANCARGTSRAPTISRLSMRKAGRLSMRQIKKCTRSRRPSNWPDTIRALTSAPADSPSSSISSRRAAPSGVSPGQTPPPGRFHSARYEERTSSTASPTQIATSAPSCEARRRRHHSRASGKPAR